VRLPSVASLDVNHGHRVNPPILFVAARNILVGAPGCAIVACVGSIVCMRLRSSDKIRQHLWCWATSGIAGHATLAAAWALESSL